MKVVNGLVFIFITGAMLSFSQCYAAVQTLQCKSIEQDQLFTLKTISVTHDIEKVVLTDSKGNGHEYLVEGIKKIPVGDEKALFGLLISTDEMQRHDELLLQPDSYFEMYVSQERGRQPGSANTIFFSIIKNLQRKYFT